MKLEDIKVRTEILCNNIQERTDCITILEFNGFRLLLWSLTGDSVIRIFPKTKEFSTFLCESNLQLISASDFITSNTEK